MKKRASFYLRVSTSSQTTENQRRELKAYCKRQEWKIHNIYEDSGISGTKSNRPALNKLLKDAQEGKAGDILLVYKIDRLGRSTVDLLRILTELKNAGVDFCSITQAIDTSTAYGKMVLTFLGAIAEFERDTIVERVKSGLERAKANGIQLGRPRKGFDIGKALELRKQGKGYKTISKILNVPKSTGA